MAFVYEEVGEENRELWESNKYLRKKQKHYVKLSAWNYIRHS